MEPQVSHEPPRCSLPPGQAVHQTQLQAAWEMRPTWWHCHAGTWRGPTVTGRLWHLCVLPNGRDGPPIRHVGPRAMLCSLLTRMEAEGFLVSQPPKPTNRGWGTPGLSLPNWLLCSGPHTSRIVGREAWRLDWCQTNL